MYLKKLLTVDVVCSCLISEALRIRTSKLKKMYNAALSEPNT